MTSEGGEKQVKCMTAMVYVGGNKLQAREKGYFMGTILHHTDSLR